MKAEDKFKAYCKCCMKQIDLGKMGEGALKSHEKSEKHKVNMRSVSDQPIMKTLTVPPPPQEVPSTAQQPTTSRQIGDFFSKNDVLKAETLWTLHTVANHNSYKSNETISEFISHN